MARYDEPEARGVGSAEFHGLSGADLLGLTPSAHASMAMWRLQYSPQMWLGATTGPMKWHGTALIGGSIPKSFLNTLGGYLPDNGFGNVGRKGMNLVGNFIGGWEGNFVDPATQAVMKRGSYNVFSREGTKQFGRVYTEEASGRMMTAEGVIGRRMEGVRASAYGRRFGAGMHGPLATPEEIVMRRLESKSAFTAAGNVGNQLWRLRALKIMGGANVVLTTAMLADLAANIAYGGVVATNALAQKLSTSNLLDMTSGANIVGAYGASTERQRALQAIQSNNLNARRFIGSEAAMMHQ